ncbi:DUF2750 domain-containing protein [Chitinimonas arctica]|uniref:DUF2750 domain-containing protein n=1 Tax=Chitinimonas arctica TaxID=2594795 RepID=A0A516SLC9_9NEIS|nr:DUF2750 domain-containing protein [Chitinimonas arctica]QDQ28967.1 DUF2750 domain-containing protein [Chitinimonas arctica]
MMAIHLMADLESDKQRFITRARQSGKVWGLRWKEDGEDKWAYCLSNNTEGDDDLESDISVFVFWSDQAYARRHAVAEWAKYVATSIELDEFIEYWLSNMQEEGVLVGVNFNAELAGIELEPAVLAEALAG